MRILFWWLITRITHVLAKMFVFVSEKFLDFDTLLIQRFERALSDWKKRFDKKAKELHQADSKKEK